MKLPQTWQDWVAGTSQLVLFLALLPTIFGTNKPELLTSIITALALSTLSITFFSLKLPYSGAISFCTALAWYVLFFQAFFS
jgi:hypothetical protein